MNNYKNKDWLIQKYIREKLTIKKISQLAGVSYGWIWHFLNKFNIERRPAHIPKGFKRSKESREKYSTYRRAHPLSFFGEKNPNWKGGIIINRNGYIYQLNPKHPNKVKKRYVYAHRIIAEKALGRFLKKSEVIHHINFDTSDNWPENLLLCTQSYHDWLHAKIKRLNLGSYFKSLAGGIA